MRHFSRVFNTAASPRGSALGRQLQPLASPRGFCTLVLRSMINHLTSPCLPIAAVRGQLTRNSQNFELRLGYRSLKGFHPYKLLTLLRTRADLKRCGEYIKCWLTLLS